jgi:hypothetical protein
MSREYPKWICERCGLKYGLKRPLRISTWHVPDKDNAEDACGWCNTNVDSLTEPRDFGYPKRP